MRADMRHTNGHNSDTKPPTMSPEGLVLPQGAQAIASEDIAIELTNAEGHSNVGTTITPRCPLAASRTLTQCCLGHQR